MLRPIKKYLSTMEIIENKDRIYNNKNLFNPETGKLIFDTWADTLGRITLTDKKYVYYIAAFYNGNNEWNNRRCKLLNEFGQPVFTREYNSIEVWCEGLFGAPIILMGTLASDGLRYLMDIEENLLSEGHQAIQPYAQINKYVEVYNKSGDKQKTSFLTFPDFKQITPEYFDDICRDSDRTRPFWDNPDFVAVVKHQGRYYALFKDGSLRPAPLTKRA